MNKWVEHVKAFSKKNNISYGCAISNEDCKKEYRESKSQSGARISKSVPISGEKVKNIIPIITDTKVKIPKKKKKPFIIEEETKVEEPKKFNQTAVNKVMQDKFLPLEIKKFLPDYEEKFKEIKKLWKNFIQYNNTKIDIIEIAAGDYSYFTKKDVKYIRDKQIELLEVFNPIRNAVFKQIKIYFDSKSKSDEIENLYYDASDIDNYEFDDTGFDPTNETFSKKEFTTYSIEANNVFIRTFFEIMKIMGIEKKEAKKLYFEAKRDL